MISKQDQEKGVLAKLLEKGINILLKKECKEIVNLKIDILATSFEIIKGILHKITIKAEEINYKNLFFDSIELEANDVKIKLKINNNELKFEKDIIMKFKISLSENSLKKILLHSNWNWISDLISHKILNEDKLENIKIENNHILIKDKKYINQHNKINIKIKKGNLYLENELCNESIRIPIEDKIFFKDVSIENNLINISAESSIDFI